MRLALAVATLLSPPALAQTQAQKNVMDHVAQVLAISNKCTSLEPNNLLLAMLLQESKIDVEHSPYREFVMARGAEHTRKIARFKEEIICVSGKTLYGKNGANVPGLLRE